MNGKPIATLSTPTHNQRFDASSQQNTFFSARIERKKAKEEGKEREENCAINKLPFRIRDSSLHQMVILWSTLVLLMGIFNSQTPFVRWWSLSLRLFYLFPRKCVRISLLFVCSSFIIRSSFISIIVVPVVACSYAHTSPRLLRLLCSINLHRMRAVLC